MRTDLRDLFKELQRKIKADEEHRRQFEQEYGHIRRPTGVNVEGKMFMAFDGVIYQQVREGPYDFIDAIHDHALHFFGESFLDAEDRKPLAARHPAIQWIHRHIEQCSLHGQTNRHDGNGAAWFRFAYDLFTIRDNSRLESDLKKKLLTSENFQAARYELKVAAICATAGFELAFENEADNSTKHPEFIGTDRFTGAKIAVEAKSRHRHGVLGFGFEQAFEPCPAVGIRGLVLDAFQKRSALPLYVFIDANLPPRELSVMKGWEGELKQLVFDLEAEGYMRPCPANAVLVTNDPSHYVGDSTIGAEADSLWVRCYTSPDPANPHPQQDMVQRLLIAHKQRVVPPTEFRESP